MAVSRNASMVSRNCSGGSGSHVMGARQHADRTIAGQLALACRLLSPPGDTVEPEVPPRASHLGRSRLQRDALGDAQVALRHILHGLARGLRGIRGASGIHDVRRARLQRQAASDDAISGDTRIRITPASDARPSPTARVAHAYHVGIGAMQGRVAGTASLPPTSSVTGRHRAEARTSSDDWFSARA